MNTQSMLADERLLTQQTPAFRMAKINVQKSLWRLKQGIWLYFFLLIFEGALRKWFLPGLATPLLIIRDPLALWLIGNAWSQHRLRTNPYMLIMVFIGLLSTFTAVLGGHGSLAVALFGARTLLLHFPLIFVIGTLFSYGDVIKLGTITLWIAIPMAILITVQFYSPQSAWVNLGVGADSAGAGFSGALDYFRPPGTFSFTNGTTLFFSFVGCFVFFFWLNPNTVNRFLLIGATAGLLLAIPISISRGLALQVGVTVFFMALSVSRRPKYVGQLLLACIGLALTLVLLNQTSFYKTSTEALTARFESANEADGGFEKSIVERFLGGFSNAANESTSLPFWGVGLGAGTNVGAQILSGNRIFLVAEEEWPRIIGELGLMLGFFVISIRVGVVTKLIVASYRQVRAGSFLPWMLLSFGGSTLLQGGWAQPTSLGFSTLVSGLMIAALKGKNNH